MSTYYVATTGNDGNPGTLANPFLTIQKGVDAALPGDTIIVRDGTYSSTNQYHTIFWRGGKSGNYITIRAENKGGAIIDGGNVSSYGLTFMAGVSYITISGFEIKNLKWAGVWMNNADNPNTFITIEQNNIHHIGRRDETSPYGICGMFVAGADNITFKQNIVSNIGRLDPSEGGTNIYYENNDHGIYIGSGSNINIEYNIFHHCNRGWALHFYPNLATGINIYNNTFDFGNPYRNGSHVILACAITNANIKNNIFGGSVASDFAISCADNWGTYTNINITNNIVNGGGSTGNITENVVSGITLSNNQENTDPLMVDPASYDFHLQAGSPAINAGVNVGLTTDFEGNPILGTPNMGAFEYLGTTTTTTTPGPTTTTTTSSTTIPVYLWWNVQKSGTATRNNCPADYMGTTVTYTVLAGTYGSAISQADADAQAQADVNANKQTYANTYGTCIHIATYYNVRMSRKAVKNDCPYGYIGSTVTYTVVYGKYTSTISQADADAKAVADLNANTQLYANIKGRCRKRR